MAKIHSAVGKGQKNVPADVQTVQSLLNKNIGLLSPNKPIAETGVFDDNLGRLILEFQRRVLHRSSPDGIVSVKGATIRSLSTHSHSSSVHVRKSQLTNADFVVAADKLHCEVAAIRAVAETETKRSPFDGKGRPAILFERHLFSKFTSGRFDKSSSTLSNPEAGGYGTFAEQYPKLEQASKLDKTAALKACSWGMFQILGSNHTAAGYSTVEEFVKAMQKSEKEHLNAFVSFVDNNPAMKKALQDKHWATFAQYYNGKAYKKNNYDVKMKENYDRILKEQTPSNAVVIP